jgi:hypothetical protein
METAEMRVLTVAEYRKADHKSNEDIKENWCKIRRYEHKNKELANEMTRTLGKNG